MPTTCSVQFENNPNKVIYTGQVLRGTVQLNLTKNKNVRGVYICIYGRAHTSWTELVPKTHYDSREKKHKTEYVHQTYTAREDYIKERTYFVGGSSGEFQLMPGTYNYSFQCMLPSNLPTSFEGKYGHIRYTAQVVLDIPMWTNRTFEYPFTVIKGVNLNIDPALRQPLVAKKVKTFGLISKRTMMIDATVPLGGYVPGQTINLQINVNNQSKETVSKFSVKLVKNVTFYATHLWNKQHKTEKTTINQQDATGCDANSNTSFHVNLVVPSVPPTDSISSNIIKVVYTLHVKGTLGFLHSNPVLDFPIIIGSYPIQDIVPMQTVYPHPNMVQVQTTVVPTFDPTPSHPEKDLSTHEPTAPPQSTSQGVYPTLPSAPLANDDPPTYEAAISDGYGNTFQPSYPMYKPSES